MPEKRKSVWPQDGLCRQVSDPEIYFPEDRRSEIARNAKRICRRCPVAGECLEAALLRDERFGIWGGMDERDRDNYLRKLSERRGGRRA